MLSKTKQIITTNLILRKEKQFENIVARNFKNRTVNYNVRHLTPLQKKEIDDFYIKNLGHKIDYRYHTYYFSRNNFFSPKYVPSSLYQARIVSRLNDMRVRDAYVDKNQFETLFPQIKHPKAIIKCINGYYYHENHPISEKDAIHLCNTSVKDLVIKPSLESSHGDNVELLKAQNALSNDALIKLFNTYGKHFIIQERIEQHMDMSALNPTSVNTVRLLTYRRDNTIELLYAVARIGRKGEFIDNESKGGITCKINKDGCLNKFAYGSLNEGKITQTDSGVIIDNYKIPSYNKIVEIVKTLHLNLPYFNLAGWDIAIEKDGAPLFIEWNLRTELSQTAAGPAFGDFTEEVLEKTRILPTTRYYIIGQRKFNS